MSFSTGKISMSKAVAVRSEEAAAAKALENSLIFTVFKFAGMICATIASGGVKPCKTRLNQVGVDRWLSYQFLESNFLVKINKLFRDCGRDEFDKVPPFWEEVFNKAGGNLNLSACCLKVFDDDLRDEGIEETKVRFDSILKEIKAMGKLWTVEEDFFGKKREVKITVEIKEVEIKDERDLEFICAAVTFFGPAKDFVTPQKSPKQSPGTRISLNSPSFVSPSQSNKRNSSEISNSESQLASTGPSSQPGRKVAPKSKANEHKE